MAGDGRGDGPRGSGPRGSGPRGTGPRGAGPRGGGPWGGRDGQGPRGQAPRRDADARDRAPARERLRSADPARTAAYRVLQQVREADAYANLALPVVLRELRLKGRDAAFATELTYGTLRQLGLYDAVLATLVDRPLDRVDGPTRDVLRLGVHQLLGMRVPDHAAVASTVGLARQEVGTGASGLVNAVLRRVAERDLDAWLEVVAPAVTGAGRAADDALAVRHSHPRWVVRALRQALVSHGRDAAETEALLRADNAPADVALLARPGLVDPAALVAAGGRTGRWSPYAVTLPSGAPGELVDVRESRARVQDEGSQLVTLALAAAPLDPPAEGAERWLDLCAGPGGKSSLLSALARREGHRGTSVEVSRHRAELVRQAVAGAEDVWDVRTGDGRAVGEDEPAAYDRVLVDAPCTGLGALRRRPEARWRRTPDDLAALAPLQRDLLRAGLTATRPGGVVAYVTCSPHPAETGLVVDDVVRRAARDGIGATVLDAGDALEAAVGEVPGARAGSHVQLWPHVHGTDGMFLALLRRT
ncbi:RsmB/NOP family class I SAM-dependent RNA methyltransferase [Aquipuribacter sp. SD81]|uniref:RsmB/NOP family class I SAM-dependent RNA methyltransferase n=1 Tax=Aquipuribacter sp. SD81 TaxID=3127703 RepID=UPI003019BDD1